MDVKLWNTKIPVIKTLYWILVLIIAFFIFINFLQVSGIGKKQEASFDKAITGTAYRPFAYRVFLPIVANILNPLVPKRAALKFDTVLDTIVGNQIIMKKLRGNKFLRQVAIILLIMYLSLVGFVFAIWRLIKDLGYGSKTQCIFPLLALIGCIPFFNGFGYMYDLPVLFFSAMGLLFMFEKKWRWFLIIFACATLNKETSIFLFAIFAIYFYKKMSGREFLLLSAYQISIYGLLHGIIMFVFRNNPGSIVEWHFDDQVDYLKSVIQTTPLLIVYWTTAIAIITTLIVYKWHDKSLLLRTALWVLPVFLILYILWGAPREIRGLLEVYPTVSILLLPPPASNLNEQSGFPPLATGSLHN